ncbi:MAG: hypothetical protein IJE05_04685 [Clostridia bacterium]|nr:hypothetical protein [Clostridia bacterium]
MKILKNEKVLKISSILILMLALVLGGMGNKSATGTETQVQTQKEKINVMYNTHIQNNGWEKDFSKKDGEMSGTQGKSLRLEAIKIKVGQTSENIGIKYQTHVQNVGWQGWKKNGELSGTQGKSLRLEGIKIQLENAEKYSVMYRVHVQDIGWQGWKSDGELAGTTGLSKRLEAIEIKIVDKIEKGQLNIDTAISNTYYNNSIIKVSGWKMANVADTQIKVTLDNNKIENINYVQRQDVIKAVTNYGTIKENPKPGFNFEIDTKNLTDGEHSLKIELVTKENKILKTYSKKIKIDRSIHVQYSAHVQNIGWQSSKKDGELSGTTGKNLRLEAIKINGINLPEGMTIKYQTHIQDIGWQGWKKEGEVSGVTGKSKRLEAIKIKIEGTTEYSIMYRTHVENVGWQSWCYDGESSGTEGLSRRIEAIEIKIVPKITKSKTNMFIDNPTAEITNENQKISGWIMTNVQNVSLKILIDNKEIDLSKLQRTTRKDVLNVMKGYGDETIFNKTPGFEVYVDFSKYSLGTHSIKMQAINQDKVIKEVTKQFTVRQKIYYTTGTYGFSGLKVKGDSRGTDLKYYQYGSGPNVFFATFAVHGFEDKWAKDGTELVEIANNFYQRLISSNDYDLANKWTIYILPGVNQDGLNYGYTNNGPGRTTLYSQAPGNKGIDLNRCWQIGSSYTRYTDSRNYNGTSGFQAYESQYLRNFLINHKSQNGQTILVDLHGWTQQVIGDSGICSYYSKQFPENDRSSVGRYGTGYLINWARNSLGSTTKTARSALIELPNGGINGHQSVVNNNFSNRYIEATIDMLKNI